MQKLSILFLFSFLSCFQNSNAQQPKKPTAVDIYSQIQKLNFLGSVLYVAAHPDDENTRLISYMANHQKARTGYLSLTRGDGGQNLIGTELRELLGVIRTQELIEARKIDGGEQFFSRANDFGYSKIPNETLKVWNKDQVLSDMVYVIRNFQPDVIITRFDHRSPGTTHGHHTSSAMLSQEAFDIAIDKSVYPSQLELVKPWQPKRLLFNTSYWFYGGKDKFDKADKSALVNLPTGIYYQSLGKSNQEIAALSRSRHQSQGFGSTGSRGDDMEYMELIKGNAPKEKNNLFEGIDTSWNRIKGGNAIGTVLQNVEKNFDFRNPSASISELVKAYSMIQKLEDEHWKAVKSKEIKEIIASCAGLYLEAVAENQEATPGSAIKLKLEAINRSDVRIDLTSVKVFPERKEFLQNKTLNRNNDENIEIDITIPQNASYTDPYWLKKEGTVGMYRVDEQKNIGVPDIIREIKTEFVITTNGVALPYERLVVYKYNDEVKGEVYKPFDIVPDVTTTFSDKVKIFNNNKSKTIGVKIKAGKNNIKGNLHLELPSGWKVTPSGIPFEMERKGSEQTVIFEITPPANASEIEAKAIAVIDGKAFDKEQIIINYEHISNQQVLKTSSAKFIKLDIKTGNEKIAYIMGAGDEVPEYLMQMGYDVSVIKPTEISNEKMQAFDVAIIGIRAYNTIDELEFKQSILFDFVKAGKAMIVQYNTTGKFVTKELAPFPLKISRDRVTEEDAEVRFLQTNHKILNSPNKITSNDFTGWVQEQGLYYPDEWDKAFTPLLSSNDNGENPKNGALLVANYGKGYYIYTGLSFFRELPAGVPGAYRLLANMISVGSKNN